MWFHSLGTWISLSLHGWPSSGYGSTLSMLTLAGFQGCYYGNHFVCLFVSSLFICFLGPQCITRGGIFHDRSLSSVARDVSCMARDESRKSRDKPGMTGDYCRPEESID
jgi:hypothetical protein